MEPEPAFFKPLEPGQLTIVAEVVSKLTGSETLATKIIFILLNFFFAQRVKY